MWNPFARKPAPAVIDPRDARIADLITERDALRNGITAKEKRINGLIEENTSLTNANGALDRVAKKYKAERDDARATLTEIVALETPGCAHVGKKMAALARNALPGEATEPKKAAA